jgi:hypothetical protein
MLTENLHGKMYKTMHIVIAFNIFYNFVESVLGRTYIYKKLSKSKQSVFYSKLFYSKPRSFPAG